MPARYVSGDFYDFRYIPSGALQLVIADIAGKGIPAALLTVTARAFLRAEEFDFSLPDDILARLNHRIFGDLTGAEKFITMQITQIESETGKISYSSAGHTESLLYLNRMDKIAKLEPTTLPLGIVESLITDVKEFHMMPGDVLLLYSDGVTEAMNSGGLLFGIDRLMETMLEMGRAGLDVNVMIDRIHEILNEFIGSEELTDDITLIVIKAETRSFSIQAKAELNNLDLLVKWVRSKCSAFGEESAGRIEVAVSELITNIIKHSYGTNPEDTGEDLIKIEVKLDSEQLQLVFYDSGQTFDLSEVSEPDLSEINESGYGIWLIRQIMDEVEYIPGNGNSKNQWLLRKYCN